MRRFRFVGFLHTSFKCFSYLDTSYVSVPFLGCLCTVSVTHESFIYPLFIIIIAGFCLYIVLLKEKEIIICLLFFLQKGLVFQCGMIFLFIFEFYVIVTYSIIDDLFFEGIYTCWNFLYEAKGSLTFLYCLYDSVRKNWIGNSLIPYKREAVTLRFLRKIPTSFNPL